MSRSRTNARWVFLNVPYGPRHEWLLLSLTAALVAIGRVPRLTFEVPDGGQGRLARILDLLGACRVSIHDLSAVGRPPRFNMPFELGLACAIKEFRDQHDFLVLERRNHRFDKHLSDLKWIDPKIHEGKISGAINAVLDSLETDEPGGNPSSTDVMRLYRRMRRMVPLLKHQHNATSLFSRRIYNELVALGTIEAQKMGL